ncbi:DUF349 domain-containing protein [Lutibacter sp. B1]|uniref:DUF349 domain-containing protein n=1 Tax=Lutibacter sp. B1 TaxID=2725996 RepID=UPI00145633CA|nr:DUF349 domain-containing protein [Lutibacter sp. B1]NLP58177.1 DUF349 domain-containing protein [Lutibacter sp. B1]
MLDNNNKLPVEDNNSNPDHTKKTETSKKNELDEVKIVSSNQAIDEIESKIAESSENVDFQDEEMLDYSSFTLEDLVNELSNLVKNKPVQSIQNNVNNIKSVFNVKFGTLLRKEKEKFLEEGGNIVDFQYKNPLKTTYNSILYDFKVKRNEFFSNQENKLKENLQAKLDLIEELKDLIDNADGATMYKMFKDIQARWREIGPIPRAKYNDTWRTYHHHVERFYDLLHLNNDLRELDFKHNLEEKQKLVEKAEELAELEDVNVAFKELQVLHKLWKEEVGPVASEFREEVWERFSAATKKVHDKRHEFFKDLKSKYEKNIEKKLEVINQIKAYDTSKNHTRIDWQKSIKDIEELRNKFFSLGKVPRSKNDDVWNKFKEATKKFNTEKNQFFKDVKKQHLENLNKKKALIEKAIELKDSEDWDTATEIMKKIQADWKTIGHVPRKYSDKLWKEFKDACNHYFDRLHNKQDEGNKEELEVFNKKKALLKQLKEKVEKKNEFTLESLKEYIETWRNLGRVPYEMRHIEAKFNKLLDKIIDSSPIDKKEVEMIKFENLVNSYLDQKNYRKLDSEQLFVRKKIDETIREIQQLENNIGFISNVSDKNPLVMNVRGHIDEYKEKLELWKAKLDYLKQLNY